VLQGGVGQDRAVANDHVVDGDIFELRFGQVPVLRVNPGRGVEKLKGGSGWRARGWPRKTRSTVPMFLPVALEDVGEELLFPQHAGMISIAEVVIVSERIGDAVRLKT